MSVVRNLRGLLALTALGGVLATAGASQADDLGWSYASATAIKCFVGHCAASEQITLQTDTHFGSTGDSSAAANGGIYGSSWARAETGEGLPELHAFAAANITGPAFGISYAVVQGVAGFKNMGDDTLIIPLNAFVGELEYRMQGPAFGVGTISAALAITTDAITDPTVATEWFRNGAFGGNFAATCDTAGAIALGNSAVVNGPATIGPGMDTLTVAANSCTGAESFELAKGETFYMWARLSVARAVAGATNAGDTFSIAFSPLASDELKQQLALNLVQVDGGNIAPSIPEPATWTMLIMGFGGVGSLLRRRRSLAVA